MNITQRLTVQSKGGALHVVAIWQGLARYADKIGGVSAHVDAVRGAESLVIDVVDVCQDQMLGVAAELDRSTLPMMATVEPVWQGASAPASRQPHEAGTRTG